VDFWFFCQEAQGELEMTNRFEALLAHAVVVFDGADATMMMAKGLDIGTCTELLNVTNPDGVKDLHREYIAAGAEVIEANSFGANRVKLSKSGNDERTVELNFLAAKLARDVAGDGIAVAAAIGPTGEFLEPVGDLTYDYAVAIYREQMRALEEGGADVILIETMSDLGEVKAALQAARESTTLPVLCTMTFEPNFRTLTGVTPAKAAQALRELGAPVIGVNCGFGPREVETILRQMKEAYPEAVLMAQPNAGIPRLNDDGSVTYPETPKVMADYARRFVEMGVKIVGACCGSTPEHTRAIAAAVRSR
jgi:5-methyltetrahydrofolate--homocysteine methyltransferase